MSLHSRNVVFVAPNWLGDAVMSLPLLGFLATAAGIRVVVLSRSYVARVYWGLEDAAELIVPPDGGRVRRAAAVRGLLREIGADGAVVLPPSFSSALAVATAGVRIRVGFRSDGRGPLLTHSLPTRGLRDEHLHKNYMRLGRLLLNAMRIPAPDVFKTPTVRVFANERERLVHTLDAAGIEPGAYVAVVPGATYGSTKSWPADKFRRLIELLSVETPVVVGGSAAERAMCEAIARDIPRVHNLAGETTLGEFVALLDDARLVVANDSGAPHVAASLGTPVVVIFGSTSPTWTTPLGRGDNVRVVRAPVPCAPCFRKTCPTRLECYEGISPDGVLEVAREELKKNVEKWSSG